MSQKYNESLMDPAQEPWLKVRGTKNRIAAYLWFNVNEGSPFTLDEVRKAINVMEQTQSDRRLRELREQRWVIEGYKTVKDIKSNSYILKKKGNKIWIGEKDERDVISNKIRRQVFARDNNTCVVCGVVSGEKYPDSTSEIARLTVGHRIPNQRLGAATLDNLQTECARCNEPIRNLLEDPETFIDIQADIDDLDLESLKVLLKWVKAGVRTPSAIDVLYSRYKLINPSEKTIALEYMEKRVGEM